MYNRRTKLLPTLPQGFNSDSAFKSDSDQVHTNSALQGLAFLRTAAARQYCGNLPASTFFAFVQRGLLPKPYKLGGTRLYKKSELDAAIEKLPTDSLLNCQ